MIHDVHKKLLLRNERQKQNRKQQERQEEEADGEGVKQVEMTIRWQQEVYGRRQPDK